jgi:hypothetical protein
MHSDRSVGPPEILKGVAKGVRGSEYVVVKNAGNLPLMHRTEEFQQIVLDSVAGDGKLGQNSLVFISSKLCLSAHLFRLLVLTLATQHRCQVMLINVSGCSLPTHIRK